MSSTISCICPSAEEADSLKEFSFEFFRSVAQFSPYRWDNHIPETNLLMKAAYLALIEETQQDRMAFRYVMVKKSGSTVGVIYFQIVTFQSDQLMNYYPAGNSLGLRAGRALSNQILSGIRLRMLVSGNIFMTGENGFYFSSAIDKPTRSKLLRQAIRQLLQDDSSLKAVLISDLYAPGSDFDTGFRECGYHRIQVESDMSIRIEDSWNNFDDYLQALTSKYRVRAKKVLALCESNHVTCRELELDQIKTSEQRLFELYRKVMSQADFHLGELAPEYFRKQKEQLPQHYRIFAYYKEECMIGFISLFHSGKKVEVHYTGMDHTICRPIHLYQHMMYDMVKFGITQQAERLHFGRTAPEIKSTIGAQPSPMYGYLKHRHVLFNQFIMKPYAKRLQPPAYTFRNPFK